MAVTLQLLYAELVGRAEQLVAGHREALRQASHLFQRLLQISSTGETQTRRIAEQITRRVPMLAKRNHLLTVEN